MPIVTTESQRETYQKLPPYFSLNHRGGKLYLFNIGPCASQTFREKLVAKLTSDNFAILGSNVQFSGGRADKGLVKLLSVTSSENVMLKRTRYTLSELRGHFSSSSNLSKNDKEANRKDSSYYLQANAWFSATKAYRDTASLDPEAPSPEIAFEECLGVYIRNIHRLGGGN